MSDSFEFHDQAALVERLTNGLVRRPQEVVFLVGAPLSAPISPGLPGVPGVQGVIDLIRNEFSDDPSQTEELNTLLKKAGENQYQAAFYFLQGRRGQQTANEIVRTSVYGALDLSQREKEQKKAIFLPSDEMCRFLESDLEAWVLSPGTTSLGKLLVQNPKIFGGSILTTNFDPLIEISIRKSGGTYFRTTLHRDGNLSQTEGIGCHVVHLHGYWFGSDTLHTARQLSQSRPRLKASLRSFLANKLIVTCAYSGWDDTFTQALIEVVLDDTIYPEILWTFYSHDPRPSVKLTERLGAGIDRGRVNLYAGVDCNIFLPELYSRWANATAKESSPQSARLLQVTLNPRLQHEIVEALIESRYEESILIEGDDEDRPPVVDICVGRDTELATIHSSAARAVFLTGFGGQGKSTLAAKYFAECQHPYETFEMLVWRDCKEERERFENQLISVIEKLSNGRVGGADFSLQEPDAIVESFLSIIKDRRVLLVFDNVDHYVDLDKARMIGAAGIFVDAFLRSGAPSRVIFTCRPDVDYDDANTLTCRLEGLTFEAATQLFTERHALTRVDEIQDAHTLTEGHAFWLDLLAIQVAKRAPNISLTKLVDEIRAGSGPLPAATLASIWATLHEREQIVLRAMAETVKPESEDQIAEYLGSRLNYQRTMRAIRALRSLNLIVIKRGRGRKDLLELHPLVRQFVRRNFLPQERLSFIDAILNVYRRLIGINRSRLERNPSLTTLQVWTQNAELDIAAGRIEDAFSSLKDVRVQFLSSAYTREFSRVMRMVLASFNWQLEHINFTDFEVMFNTHVATLSYLGEITEVDELLDQYETTVSARDVRYIKYCEMRCVAYWQRSQFPDALDWGQRGEDLRKESDVDTKSDISHTLALVQRDSGRPEDALPEFLGGRRIEEVTDPQEFDENRSGPHYGNIGRCLQFMGQLDQALICFQKSAILLENRVQTNHVYNQGFIRKWLGEVFVARGQALLGGVFLRAAYLKWMETSPPRAVDAMSMYREIEGRRKELSEIGDREIEKTCLDWIFSRPLEAKYSS